MNKKASANTKTVEKLLINGLLFGFDSRLTDVAHL